MKREAKILKLINKAGNGIEIGPSYNPIAPKKSGYMVEIIDHLNREQLIAHYQGLSVQVDTIEEVDYVWNGEPYQQLTGKTRHYDWIIASHIIEHTPNLIGFLESCHQILKDDGVLSLAVPDSRYCFDHFRPLTSLGQVLDAHHLNRTQPSAGTVYEYHMNVVSKGGRITWLRWYPGGYRLVHTKEEAQQAMEKVLREQVYWDVHVWCFTPSSFRLLIHDLFQMGLSPFRELVFYPTVGCEFFITLGKQENSKPIDRLDLLKRIRAELTT